MITKQQNQDLNPSSAFPVYAFNYCPSCLHLYLFPLHVYTILFKIKFIGVIVVNNIIYVSDVQLYNMTSVYSKVYSTPKVQSPSVTIYLTPFIFFVFLPHPALLLLTTILLSVSTSFFVCSDRPFVAFWFICHQ